MFCGNPTITPQCCHWMETMSVHVSRMIKLKSCINSVALHSFTGALVLVLPSVCCHDNITYNICVYFMYMYLFAYKPLWSVKSW